MQRMHVGLKVSNIGEAVAFYSKLFGAEPDLLRSDYAKWMLDDPFVNFSVDLHGDGPAGSAHFGLQQLDAPELAYARKRIDDASLPARTRMTSSAATNSNTKAGCSVLTVRPGRSSTRRAWHPTARMAATRCPTLAPSDQPPRWVKLSRRKL